MTIRMLVVAAAVAAMSFSGGRAHAFDGEPALYEAAKKEKEFTWYTAHYDSETAAAVCNGFDKKYEEIDKGIPEVKELFRETFGI